MSGGHGGYGVTGAPGVGGGGGGGGQQFAFHEPQPGARRLRAVNGGGGGNMALDPRARARALGGVSVGGSLAGGGIGVGGRKMVRPGVGGGAPGGMTAEEMERIVSGN